MTCKKCGTKALPGMTRCRKHAAPCRMEGCWLPKREGYATCEEHFVHEVMFDGSWKPFDLDRKLRR
jgi:hypothetical protein